MLRYGEERQIIDAGFVLTDELREQLGDLSFGGLDPQRPGLFETFHTDDTYAERPRSRRCSTLVSCRPDPAATRGSSTCAPPTACSPTTTAAA